jgi:hypothetical protein
MFDVLPYAEGASWNPKLACLPDTRTALIDDIITWIDSADGSKTAEILWLSDVAGAGKTAIAHTVAQHCANHGLLASSFFFDRNIPDRRSPQKLFSTIARDLVTLHDNLADYVGAVLENDRSLASACQSRQFDKLILEPARHNSFKRPIAIVIDGLDEGYDLETLEVFRDKVPGLPGNFRIVLTSRPLDDIVADLSGVGHIQRRSIDIHSEANKNDIGAYARDRLRYISSRRRFAADWPGAQRTQDLIVKAEGLFVWVSIVSEFLRTVAHPDQKLSTLLYQKKRSGISAEAKMDALYAEIFSTCDWDDDDFVQDYHSLMGTIMAAKSPLSSSSLRSLHRNNPTLEIDGVLRPLSSLLTGVFEDNQPVQILHLSFRDFITGRAQSSVIYQRFHASEEEHNQKLAILCLRVLSEDLTSNTPGAGYLTGLMPDTEGIPSVDKSHISEVLCYACRFWTEHIIEIEGPASATLLDSLRMFLVAKITLWMEVLNTQHTFQSLTKIRSWLQVRALISNCP